MTDTLSAQQIERETRMLQDGLARAVRRDASAVQRDEQTRTESLTLAALVPPARTFLEALVATYTDGRPPSWWSVLKGLDLDEVGAAAIHTGFAAALRDLTHTKALLEFGKGLEVVKAASALREAAETTKAKRRVARLPKFADSAKGRRKVILKAAESLHEGWDEEQTIHMGEPLMNAALSTGLFTLTTDRAGTPLERIRFTMSPEGVALVQEVEDAGMLARPILRPMLVPPRAWEDLDSGAYLSDVLRRQVSLVRTNTPEHIKLLKLGVEKGNMAPILRSTSAIQAVPLRINRAVYDLREWAWGTRIDLGDTFPLRDALEVPEVPEDLEAWEEDKRRDFWANRSQIVRINDGIVPNLIAWSATSAEAQDLLGLGRFYLPHNLDFRGRAYPVPVFSHQHGDATKALFEFADGKPLGQDGMWWLMIHLANCGDFGKVSKKDYSDRVDWVQDNAPRILAVADDPTADLWWTEADAPFSFYAACLDFARALESGDPTSYVSHLPIALDGSNSGVQHYSAAMRAEEGVLVNLTPEAVPQDLYGAVGEVIARRCTKVAGLVVKALGRPLEASDWVVAMDACNAHVQALVAPAEAEERNPTKSEARIIAKAKRRRDLVAAILWHQVGVTRSTVKRPVMTFGYSAVAYGMGQQVRTDYMAPLTLQVLRGTLPRHPFGQDRGKACAAWLGRQVYRGCVNVLPRVAAAMKWLQQVATVLADQEKGVLMITPLGFPMLQKVTEWETKRVNLHLLDRSIPICGQSTPDKWEVGGSVLRRVRSQVNLKPAKAVVKHKQASGIAPNVIHTCDATHLHAVVLGLVDVGITDMLLIHDSFSTHAGAVPVLNTVLRQTFVDLYENWDPLADVMERAVKVLPPEVAQELPALPEKGVLDLQQIHHAKFCFS